MPYNNQKSEKNLFSVADKQQGFFTAKQAIRAGFQDATHPYHVRAGHWVREMRGVYRLALYPKSMEAQYVALSLWSRDRNDAPRGVFSHETALSMFDLSDVNPAKIHMTLPEGFRRQGKVPKVLALHYGPEYDDEDMKEKRGYRVIKPARTVRDMLAGGSFDPEIISQALHEGHRTGKITVEELKGLLKDFPEQGDLFPADIKKGRGY